MRALTRLLNKLPASPRMAAFTFARCLCLHGCALTGNLPQHGMPALTLPQLLLPGCLCRPPLPRRLLLPPGLAAAATLPIYDALC